MFNISQSLFLQQQSDSVMQKNITTCMCNFQRILQYWEYAILREKIFRAFILIYNKTQY